MSIPCGNVINSSTIPFSMNHPSWEPEEQGTSHGERLSCIDPFQLVKTLGAEFLLFILGWCHMELGLEVKHQEQSQFDAQSFS